MENPPLANEMRTMHIFYLQTASFRHKTHLCTAVAKQIKKRLKNKRKTPYNTIVWSLNPHETALNICNVHYWTLKLGEHRCICPMPIFSHTVSTSFPSNSHSHFNFKTAYAAIVCISAKCISFDSFTTNQKLSAIYVYYTVGCVLRSRRAHLFEKWIRFFLAAFIQEPTAILYFLRSHPSQFHSLANKRFSCKHTYTHIIDR